MKRKHKIEFTAVSIIILALSAVLVYQFRFNRKFLYEQARILCEQGRYDEAIQRYVKFLNRWEKGEYVEEARQELFCNALPNARTLLDVSHVAIAVEAFRNGESQWVRDTAELALIHTGMKASIKPGGKYDAFLKWWDETVGDIGRPPGMVLVPAGEFMMGSNVGNDDEKPQHEVYLDAYYVGKYPVTNAQYKAFVEATGHHEPEGISRNLKTGELKKDFKPWKDSEWNRPNQPVVCVSWKDANRYAEWASSRLPTEAQWEKAARGTDGREYPWGSDEPDAQKANFDGKVGKTTAVGNYPEGVSPYGCYDMAGNILEWCADWHDEKYYEKSPRENPKGPDTGSWRVLRGGSWSSSFDYPRCAARGYGNPTNMNLYIGFRVVALPRGFR